MEEEYTLVKTIPINENLLQTLRWQGNNLKAETSFEEILLSCFHAAINTFESEAFDFKVTEENKKLIETYIEKLKKLNIRAYMEEDEDDDGEKYVLYVTWY